jgi:hypothetical protein
MHTVRGESNCVNVRQLIKHMCAPSLDVCRCEKSRQFSAFLMMSVLDGNVCCDIEFALLKFCILERLTC